MKPLSLLLFLVLMPGGSYAKEYKISSAEELTKLTLKPGDRVIMKEGTWRDQKLVFKGNGTERQHIYLLVEKPGQTRLSGNSTLKIDGEWLEVDGLYFTDGFSDKDDVIVFSTVSAHCRLTNTAILNYNPPEKKLDYKWVSVFGHHNRVDHCWLEGKSHQGTTLVIWLDDQPNYDLIDHNYFGPRPALGVNGGETIRIGTSTWSFHDSKTTVEKNIFERCNGELEIISNKSCKNILRDNLFFECAGTLTLRHGNDAEVYGNYFIGRNQPNTGGIRIIGENHHVHDNYMQDLTGTGVGAALSVMAGLPNPQLTSHWQVKNALISNNILINCQQSFCIGAGRNAERYLKAENTIFRDNIISTPFQALHWADDSVQVHFSGNIVWEAADRNKIPSGFTINDPGLRVDSSGILVPAGSTNKPHFWTKEATGPNWRKETCCFSLTK